MSAETMGGKEPTDEDVLLRFDGDTTVVSAAELGLSLDQGVAEIHETPKHDSQIPIPETGIAGQVRDLKSAN